MTSANTELLDITLFNQIELLRRQLLVRKDVLSLLETLKRDVVDALQRLDPTQPVRQATQRARLEALLKEVNETIALKNKSARDMLMRRLTVIAQEESQKAADAIRVSLGVEIVIPVLTAAQIETIVGDTLIQGAPSAEWWSRQTPLLRQRFADAMRLGMARGDTVGQLVERVRGVKPRGQHPGIAGIMETNWRNAEALVRTSVQSVANEARLQVYKNNGNLVKGIMWVATLDNRTTPICQALDGKQWDLDLKPIDHDFPFPGPTAHWGCRSTQVPVLKSWEELTREAGGDTALARKLDKMPETTRASMDGQVPKSETYEKWLGRQSVERQKDILGPARYELWKDGKIKSLEELVTPEGRTVPLRRLKK